MSTGGIARGLVPAAVVVPAIVFLIYRLGIWPQVFGPFGPIETMPNIGANATVAP